jgi:large exoprotein involved in heme utilization and adhesion
LLSVSVPVGLGFGSNPGAIEVQGTGHNLTFDTSFPTAFPPFKRETNPSGLTVKPGRTLALVGGGVLLEGGQLVAERGTIELGSVGQGEVSLVQTASGFRLGYESVPKFEDIQLEQRALVDASGAGGSGIHFVGRQVTLTDGSAALIQNFAPVPAGDITVNAKESVELTGTTPNGTVRSSLNNESIGNGIGGKITVDTGNLTLDEGGQIVTRSFGTSATGDVIINVRESVEVIGSSPLNPRFFSSIFAIASRGSSGRAGDVDISTKQFTVLGGGIVSAATFGAGPAGNLTLHADRVELIGVDPIFGSPSDLTVGSSSPGSAGNLTMYTQWLTVQDGARVNASTIGSGNAGTVTVYASRSVEVSGANSTIESSVNFPSNINIVLGINTLPSGKAGDVTINTNRFSVEEGARVGARSNGPTNGGTLQVNANRISLDTEGSLTTAAVTGNGGIINLRTNLLQMEGNSTITASAGADNGNGGRITIDASVIRLENSDIIANAVKGTGGTINITTSRLFRSADSDITAVSQQGINGTVNITTSNPNSRKATNSESEVGSNATPATPSTWKVGDPIQEATHWVVNANGQVVLTADPL